MSSRPNDHSNEDQVKKKFRGNDYSAFGECLSKNQHKKAASSVQESHILSVLAKCKVLPKCERFTEEIKQCLLDLDVDEEISLVLKALQFSDHTTICLDFDRTNLLRVSESDALGWYNHEEGELLLGAKDLFNDRRHFKGVFAHELTHWCMQMVFKNNGRPYYLSDPRRTREMVFGKIVQNVKTLNDGSELHSVIKSVFKDYEANNWDREMIVRVPHLIAQNGLNDVIAILSQHAPTLQLLKYYRNYVMAEIRQYVDDGDSLKSRETVYKLNRDLGILGHYQDYYFDFYDFIEIPQKIQDQLITSLWVCSSPHPYLSFMKVAWTLNCKETTFRFYENNVFCDFSKWNQEIISKFRKLDEFKRLIIVCSSEVNETTYKPLFNQLGNVIGSNSHKIVILFIESKWLTRTKQYLDDVPIIRYECITLEKLEFKDFTEQSRNRIMESIITVQGKKLKLGDILEDHEWHLVDGNVIERLIRNEGIRIGKKNTTKYDRPASFVSFYEKLDIRRLIDLIGQCRNNVGSTYNFALVLVGDLKNYPECLEKELCDVLSCPNLDEIVACSADFVEYRAAHGASRLPILLISSEFEAEYSRLVDILQNVSPFNLCYFINIKSRRKLVCDMIYFPGLVINRRLSTVKNSPGRDSLSGHEFTNKVRYGSDRLIILSDSAGSGKSQFLNLMYDLVVDCLVIKFMLKQCTPFIDDHLSEPGVCFDDALGFILKLAGVNDEFGERLFRLKMRGNSKFPIILLLDGMDEITSSDFDPAPENRRKIVNFINFLKSQTLVKVVITTRPEALSTQESSAQPDYLSFISCPVYKFASMSIEDVRLYIMRFCIARRNLFHFADCKDCRDFENTRKHQSECNLQKYICRLERYTNEEEFLSLNRPVHWEDIFVMARGRKAEYQFRNFLKSPLHVYMMSEIIVESMKNGNFNSIIFDPKGLLKFDRLYDEFIRIKYAIYFKEKKNIAKDDRLSEKCNSVFQMLALFVLYGSKEFAEEYLLTEDTFSRDSAGKLTINEARVNLYFDLGIISSSSGQRIEFVHRTFAEYFASWLFMSWIQDKSLSRLAVNEIIYKPKRTFSFFQSMMENSIISGDVVKAHGYVMAESPVLVTLEALKYHIEYCHLAMVDYILKCWKYAGQLRVIFDAETYSSCNLNFCVLHPLFVALYSDERVLDRVLQEDFDINHEWMDNVLIRILIKKGKLQFLKRNFENGSLTRDALKAAGALIHYAAESGNIELVIWLESLGYDIFDRADLGLPTIHLAVSHGKMDMAKWLKDRGVSLFYVDTTGKTAVHEAVRRGNIEMVQWLVHEGVDVNATDIYGWTAMDFALMCKRMDMVEVLRSLGADMSDKADIASTKQAEMICSWMMVGSVMPLQNFKVL